MAVRVEKLRAGLKLTTWQKTRLAKYQRWWNPTGNLNAPKNSEETWLIQLRRENKSSDDMLLKLFKRRKVNQPQPTKEISLPKS